MFGKYDNKRRCGQFSIGGNTSNINFTTGGSVPPPNPTPPPANLPCNNFWNFLLRFQPPSAPPSTGSLQAKNCLCRLSAAREEHTLPWETVLLCNSYIRQVTPGKTVPGLRSIIQAQPWMPEETGSSAPLQLLLLLSTFPKNNPYSPTSATGTGHGGTADAMTPLAGLAIGICSSSSNRDCDAVRFGLKHRIRNAHPGNPCSSKVF